MLEGVQLIEPVRFFPFGIGAHTTPPIERCTYETTIRQTGFAAERAAVVVIDFKLGIACVLAADLTTMSGTLQKGVPSGQIHIVGFVRDLEFGHPNVPPVTPLFRTATQLPRAPSRP